MSNQTDAFPEFESPRAGRDAVRRGFTLVEILLVLAMLALFATLLVPGVNSMFTEMNSRGPEQVIGESMLAAREEALEGNRAVELRYDADTRRFIWGDSATRSDALPLGASVDLLPVAAGASILLGGELTEAQEPLRRVRFFADGTCDSFRIRLGEVGSPPRMLLVDPWTCAVSPAPAKR
jgi:prepilin-type N-terminal cleavage/methylation domain-containing protein